MKKILFYLFCLIFVNIATYGQESYIVEIEKLDKLLEIKDVYIQQKEHRIDSLRTLLLDSTLKSEQKLLLNIDIGKEFQLFRSDSAVTYFSKSLSIARECSNKILSNEVRLHLMIALSVSGVSQECLNLERDIKRNCLPDSLLPLYYKAMEQVNRYMYLYAQSTPYDIKYRDIERLYRDSLKNSLDPNSSEARFYEAMSIGDKRDYNGAQKILIELLENIPESSHLYSQTASLLAGTYRKQSVEDMYIKYLAISAMSDIKAVVKENSALYKLAILFYKRGDINRSYKYIKYSLEDAALCNANMRAAKISQILPVINAAYQQEEQTKRRTMSVLAVTACVFSIILSVFIYLLVSQMRTLSATKKKLEKANIVKEEYIRHFVDLSSVYIGKLQSFRKTVGRKIKAGQTEDLLRMTQESEMAEIEQKEFYTNFDLAFLHLFPTFVEDVNNLLLPNEHFVLKSEELLNTELRIYALIRIGIDESSKIASFLHYSINTIYTYRNKIKNKAIDRENFEAQILKIN